MVSEEEVRHLARLVRLEVSEEEIPPLQKHFNEILEYFHSLGNMDLDGLDPYDPEESPSCPLRNDEVRLWGQRDAALEAAPEREGDYFKVPRIVGEVGKEDE